jgi:P4 family phage/plasmid primase-like protien
VVDKEGLPKMEEQQHTPVPVEVVAVPRPTQQEILILLASGQKREATEDIVRLILMDEHIYTTKNDEKPEMWSYNQGVYVPEAKSLIKRRTREILAEAYTTHIVNEVIIKIQADTFIDQDNFFNQVNVEEVVIENGILNVVTRTIRPWTAEEVFFNKLPVTYDPTADCPIFKAHLQTVLKYPDTDRAVIEEIIGYCLYKEYRIEKAVMFSGDGRNGKSKTLFVLKNLLGLGNISSMTLQQLEEDPYAATELLNKMANISGEVTDKTLESSGIFRATTGRDIISCQRKFKSMVHFQNFAKMIFSANTIPKTKDLTPAFFGRWVIIEFPYRFVTQEDYDRATPEEKVWFKIKNDNIGALMSTPVELSGVLNLALDGLSRLLAQGDFSHAKTNKEVQEIWLRKSDSFTAFAMDYIQDDYDSSISKQELLRAYSNYCRDGKLKVCGEKHIKYILETMFGCSDDRSEVAGKRIHIWDGISFKKVPPKRNSAHPAQPAQGISTLYEFSKNDIGTNTVGNLGNLANPIITPNLTEQYSQILMNTDSQPSQLSHFTKMEAPNDGRCAGCGEHRWREFELGGECYCRRCKDEEEAKKE